MADRLIVNDGPEDRCFGCGHANERGLKLRFRVAGSGEVEAEYTAPEHVCGAPGVVHGGIQAALLDEVLGMAAHAGSANEALDPVTAESQLDLVTAESQLRLVTAEFQLRYRRPVPAGVPLRVCGRLLRREDRDFYVEGEIVGPDATVLTRAEARWRQIADR